jgi:hypothetical protein
VDRESAALQSQLAVISACLLNYVAGAQSQVEFCLGAIRGFTCLIGAGRRLLPDNGR